nr:uncharacterized protein LOC124815061 [Hydra vulgaris]
MSEEELQQQQVREQEQVIQRRIRNLFQPIAPPPPEEDEDEDELIERNNYELNLPVVLLSIESTCIGCCQCFAPLRPRKPCCFRRMQGACIGCCICTFNTMQAIRDAMMEKRET